MIIEVCSQAKALELAAKEKEKTAILSIVSAEENDVPFPSNPNVGPILRLKLNDLTEEYDEDGIPYGRSLPGPEDIAGLKEFVTQLQCNRLIVHCWEGSSRSAAVAAAVYEFRGCADTMRTCQRFAPNPLIYRLACRELGMRPGKLCYAMIPEENHFRLGKDMLYIASETSGEQSFFSITSQDNCEYTFAYADPFLAIVQGMPDRSPLGESEVIAEELRGKLILWEACPNAFQKWYGGKGCVLYGVPEDRFLSGLTGWESVRVLPSGEAPAIFEERVGDVYRALLKGEEAGLCEMHAYSEDEDYRVLLQNAIKRRHAWEEEPIFVVENGVLRQFIGNDYYEKVVVPDGVDCIGYRAFADSRIGKVFLPNGLTVIEEEAFYGSSLRQIRIPESVTTIETWAFGLCENLKEVWIPDNVAEIGLWAFGYRRAWNFWDPKPNPFEITLIGLRGSEAERYVQKNYYLYNDNCVAFVERKQKGDIEI